MKRIFTLLILLTSFSFGSLSQNSHINYSKDSKWFLGINGGGTWHTRTEVKNQIKGGYGFTFGRSFGMKKENLFSWDLRFRYLHGWWAGQNADHYTLDSTSSAPAAYPSGVMQNYQDSVGYFVPNFRTQLLSGSLELALNTNRLRENTGWNFQVFGGIGIKGYNVQTDLTDGGSNIYEYNNSTATTAPDYINLQDNNFETDLVGSESDLKVDWMPSFGVGLSYQIALK